MYLCWASAVSNLYPFRRQKAFNIEFLSSRKRPTNANYYYYYFWLGSLLHNNLSNGYETHLYCCTVPIHKTRSRLQSSLRSIYMYKYFAMCARGSKVYKLLYLTAIFCHQTFDLWSSYINNIILNILYSYPTKAKMSTSTAASYRRRRAFKLNVAMANAAYIYISNYRCVIFENKLDLQIKYHSKSRRLI